MRLVAFAALTFATVALAQQFEAAARVAIEDVFPARGTSAPRNTKVWLETSFTAADFELRDGAGQAVPFTTDTLPVSGNFSSLIVVTPNQELAPGSYSVSRAGVEISAFTVTNEVDSTPPAALGVTATSESFAPVLFQPRSVGGTATTLTFDGVPELVLVTRGQQAWLPRGALTTAFRGVKTAFLSNLPEGKQEVRVFHFDLAGNVTQTDVPVDVPPVGGCSVGAGWPLALLALALMRRRS